MVPLEELLCLAQSEGLKAIAMLALVVPVRTVSYFLFKIQVIDVYAFCQELSPTKSAHIALVAML